MKEKSNWSKMFPDRHDEYQRLVIYKYGYKSWVLLLSLILLNAIYKRLTGHIWGSEYVQYSELIAISVFYFSVNIALKHAFTPHKSTFTSEIAGKFYIFLSVLYAIVAYWDLSDNGSKIFYENGMLQDRIVNASYGLMTLALGIVIIYKNKKAEREDSN